MGEREELAMKDPKWRTMIVAGVVVAALATTHVGAASSAAVGIKEFKFTPPMLAVPVGTTVTWINHDKDSR